MCVICVMSSQVLTYDIQTIIHTWKTFCHSRARNLGILVFHAFQYFKEAPHNFFKPIPSSLIGASWLRNSLPYTTIPLLYPHVWVFMAAEEF